MTQWNVEHGDILDHSADGLLCSANPNLNLSGGVGGAFALRYGTEMQEFLHESLRHQSLIHIPPGDSVIAPSCGSPFIAIAHAVSIDAFYETDIDTVIRTYRSAIRGLATHDCRTIAAACLGCGYGRMTTDAFASVSARLFEMHFDGVERITLVTTNADLAERLASILANEKRG
ncbi:MAG: macro domain-containing protein [Planctomycetota bacterium]